MSALVQRRCLMTERVTQHVTRDAGEARGRRGVVSRRAFLAGAGAAGAVLAFRPLRRALAQPRFASNPFTLGVASGHPLPDGVVLWTRLAPDPLHGGGMSAEPLPIDWDVATAEPLERA